MQLVLMNQSADWEKKNQLLTAKKHLSREIKNKSLFKNCSINVLQTKGC